MNFGEMPELDRRVFLCANPQAWRDCPSGMFLADAATWVGVAPETLMQATVACADYFHEGHPAQRPRMLRLAENWARGTDVRFAEIDEAEEMMAPRLGNLPSVFYTAMWTLGRTIYDLNDLDGEVATSIPGYNFATVIGVLQWSLAGRPGRLSESGYSKKNPELRRRSMVTANIVREYVSFEMIEEARERNEELAEHFRDPERRT